MTPMGWNFNNIRYFVCAYIQWCVNFIKVRQVSIQVRYVLQASTGTIISMAQVVQCHPRNTIQQGTAIVSMAKAIEGRNVMPAL